MRASCRLLVLSLVLAGCGDPEPSLAPVAPPTTVAPPVAPPPAPPPPPASAAITVPDDFAMSLGGGAVAGEMEAPGAMETRVRLEPRPGTTGSFDLIETNESADPTAASPPAPIELRRVPVPAERAAALYGLIVAGRSVLERPCMDPTIMDGATRFIRVHASGIDTTYTCTNATTAEFDAVDASFQALSRDLLPSAASS